MKCFKFSCIIFLSVLTKKVSSQGSIMYPVFFELRKANLDTTEEKNIKFFIQTTLKGRSIHKVEIKAYCDDRGGKKRNDILSKKRAANIQANLQPYFSMDSGFILEAQGLGFIELNKEDKIEIQRGKNRRGEILFYYSKDTNSQKPKKQLIQQKREDIKVFLKTGKVGQKINLNIQFAGGSHSLLPTAKIVLDSLATNLSANKLNVRILGHIYAPPNFKFPDGLDEETKTYNLSDNRARAVFVYLERKGIPKERMKYEGMGAKFPSGIGEHGDRRVELEILE